MIAMSWFSSKPASQQTSENMTRAARTARRGGSAVTARRNGHGASHAIGRQPSKNVKLKGQN